MPCDNFHERIEVDGRGAVPAVGEGFFVGGFDVGGGFVIFAEHLHAHFRIFVADGRAATLEIIALPRSSYQPFSAMRYMAYNAIYEGGTIIARKISDAGWCDHRNRHLAIATSVP